MVTFTGLGGIPNCSRKARLTLRQGTERPAREIMRLNKELSTSMNLGILMAVECSLLEDSIKRCVSSSSTLICF